MSEARPSPPGTALARRPPSALKVVNARTLLEWTVATHVRVVLTMSFASGGLVLAHLLRGIGARVRVLFLDTGVHFPETLAFKDDVVARYGLELVALHPDHDPGPLYATDPDACCTIRKVQPLQRALADADAWITAVRRDQSAARRTVNVVERHEVDGRTITKVMPLARWTADDVERYVRVHELPIHPLLERGYTSIGCWPCTRPTHPGEDERAGRWSGTSKTECGLHTFTTRR